jgi:radical SAM superfamily enzyme with C-terminal helix-hairpin-helix motif
MGAASSAMLLAAGCTWRLIGLHAAGRSLVVAVDRGPESEQAIAGIMLVKAGDRSVPLISESVSSGSSSPELIDVLASIGTPSARSALRNATRSPQPEVAGAAENALRTLDEIDRHQD